MSRSVLLINGPNLNLLGTREPHIYGHETLPDKKLNVKLYDFQSNHEGAIVDRIQQAREEGIKGIIINPGAYTHTSVAIRDALLGVNIPFIELHVTNVHSREAFRHHSYFSDKATAIIVGFGVKGYEYALDFVATSPKFA
ncbi:catabolic 3-dehydroquinase [Gymnopus androsaceus JB14]|uniref:Catabolic 3-dehydroquinase n=1 Tax=Gymnopus androsaceus JB14 TaxID=1447944 RepID=A0A6A4HBB4_9AGAR|nr:catabolic 3-dehydroquinase [Gymnopus androsaceus JB14]